MDLSKILPGTLAQRSTERYAEPKHRIPANVVTREDKRQAKKKNDKAFRDAVWKRDKGRCRATRVTLSHSGVDPHKVGEVDHTLLRSTHPERIYDTTNGVLMSKYLNRLRKVACLRAPEFLRFDYSGPEDRGEPQTFIWRDDDGKIKKQRIG